MNPSRMRASGFSLIELVVIVIVIGILAAVALSKLIEYAIESRVVSVQQVEASLETGVKFATLAYRSAGSVGNSVEYNDGTITFINELPRPDASQLRALIDADLPITTFTANWSTQACSGSPYCVVGNRPFSDASLPTVPGFNSGTGLFIWPENYTLSDCFAYYVNRADGSEALIGSVTSGC